MIIELGDRGLGTIVHGVVFGGLTLLLCTALASSLWNLRANELTATGRRAKLTRLKISLACASLTAWAAVLMGWFLIYPWYSDPDPSSPRSLLLARPDLKRWHVYGMETKEYIAWAVPILLSISFFLVTRFGDRLYDNTGFQRNLKWLVTLAFVIASVVATLGMCLNKIAPILS